MSGPKRVDKNHAEIVKALRQLGCYVIDTHALRGGFSCDLLVCLRGVTTFMEIKNPDQSPAHRSLTPLEQETAQQLMAAGCKLHVVYDVEGAMRAIGVLL